MMCIYHSATGRFALSTATATGVAGIDSSHGGRPLQVDDEQLLAGFAKCLELGALPQVRHDITRPKHTQLQRRLVNAQRMHPGDSHRVSIGTTLACFMCRCTRSTARPLSGHSSKCTTRASRGQRATPSRGPQSWRCGLPCLTHGKATDAAAHSKYSSVGICGVFAACTSGHVQTLDIGHLQAEATARAIRLAKFVGVPLYVVHVMAVEAMEEVGCLELHQFTAVTLCDVLHRGLLVGRLS
jgi:hypothetical protein